MNIIFEGLNNGRIMNVLIIHNWKIINRKCHYYMRLNNLWNWGWGSLYDWYYRYHMVRNTKRESLT